MIGRGQGWAGGVTVGWFQGRAGGCVMVGWVDSRWGWFQGRAGGITVGDFRAAVGVFSVLCCAPYEC